VSCNPTRISVRRLKKQTNALSRRHHIRTASGSHDSPRRVWKTQRTFGPSIFCTRGLLRITTDACYKYNLKNRLVRCFGVRSIIPRIYKRDRGVFGERYGDARAYISNDSRDGFKKCRKKKNDFRPKSRKSREPFVPVNRAPHRATRSNNNGEMVKTAHAFIDRRNRCSSRGGRTFVGEPKIIKNAKAQ